jgi:hypothetical protein
MVDRSSIDGRSIDRWYDIKSSRCRSGVRRWWRKMTSKSKRGVELKTKASLGKNHHDHGVRNSNRANFSGKAISFATTKHGGKPKFEHLSDLNLTFTFTFTFTFIALHICYCYLLNPPQPAPTPSFRHPTTTISHITPTPKHTPKMMST